MLDVKIGDVIEGAVVGSASGGEGIVKIGRFPVFIPFAIEGEAVRARVTYVKKDCAFGELIEVLIPAKDRIKPPCPYFGKCGGCDLQHMLIERQRAFKSVAVCDALRKIGGISVYVPQPIGGAPFAYRNKLSLPFSFNKVSGRVSIGFYERRSHKVVPIKWCAACGDWTGYLISALTSWANDVHASVYDETTGKGLLRYAVARMLDSLSLTLVINGDEIPCFRELIYRLEEHFPDICVYTSVNKKRTNVIFGEDVKLVYGKELPQALGRFYAVVSPRSFLQVNNEIRDKLYDGVAAALDGFSGEIVELYSGIGLLTAQLALRLSAKIVSVEIEPSSCPRALLLDPPRKGCADDVIRQASDSDIDRIVYVSCDPLTLSRDAAKLSERFELVSVQPYDMFPQTAEVETLCVFERIKK